METLKIDDKIMLYLLGHIDELNTNTKIAEAFKITRSGSWKVLKRLEQKRYIKFRELHKGQTSTLLIKPNWNYEALDLVLASYLKEESVIHQRWRKNFEELKDLADFIILYGSILHSPSKANDIDILIIADKKEFNHIQEHLDKIQKTQTKKIHSLVFTEKEFKEELKRRTKALNDAVKKGVVLFGQIKFVDFMRNLR